jgi:hypothetical protein
MLSTSSQHHGQRGLPPHPIKKRATADEIQADLQERIARYFARSGQTGGCDAPRPRPARARLEGGPNWIVDGFPGLPNGCFGALVQIVDQARLEYELVS